MSTLSIFVDESGDFGDFRSHAPHYIISLVFHDQSKNIRKQVSHLQRHIAEVGFDESHAVHTAPLIRREKEYRYLSLSERRKMFRYLYDFSRISNISYESFLFKKREFESPDMLVERMVDKVSLFVRVRTNIFPKPACIEEKLPQTNLPQKTMVAILTHVIARKRFSADEAIFTYFRHCL